MIQSKVKLPTLINIDAYIKGKPDEVPNSIEPDEPIKIFKQVQEQFKAELVDETILAISTEKDDWYIKLFDQTDHCVFTIMVSPKDNDYISDDWTADIMGYMQQMQELIAVFPKTRLANLRVIATTGFDTENEAKVFIDEYADFFNKRINEIGITYNFCLLSKDDQIENPPFDMKDYIIAPITDNRAEAERIIQEVIDDLDLLAVYEGKLDRMYRAYIDIEAKFKSMESKSISEMNNVSTILKKDLTVKELEHYLLKINSQFSEISTITATVAHDFSTVTSTISNANTIYSKWNEKEFSGYPLVHVASMRDLEIIANAYQNITNKLEVVRGRLHDSLEIIKTYLDLKQQNLSLQLQKSVDASSRSQIDLLVAQEEEKRMAESSKKSLENLTYIFAGLGLCEIVANFVVVYLSMDTPEYFTAFMLSITLLIPLVVIWVIFQTLQKRAEKKMKIELESIKNKMKTNGSNIGTKKGVKKGTKQKK
jgi:hypothetical protein